MEDKTLGYMIVLASILIMIVYFVWAFASVFGTIFAWLVPYSEWAFRLPILAAVFGALLVVLWIGYTMATTPPPIPLDNPLDLEKEEQKKKN